MYFFFNIENESYNVFTTLQQRLVKSLTYFWNIALYSFTTNVVATL